MTEAAKKTTKFDTVLVGLEDNALSYAMTVRPFDGKEAAPECEAQSHNGISRKEHHGFSSH
ncbi:MAG: hypothetical protein ABIW85_09200 [Variovorax sp.]